MATHETLLILDFGAQYTQLIARRVRELGVFSEIRRGDLPACEIRRLSPIGVVLSGGPASIYEDGAIQPDPGVFALGVPVLGLCYGQQAMAHLLGGRVEPAGSREYGAAELEADLACPLFAGTKAVQRVWMSHGDRVERLPDGFRVVGHTANAPVAAMADEARRLFGIQFHPEVRHTELGRPDPRQLPLGVQRAARLDPGLDPARGGLAHPRPGAGRPDHRGALRAGWTPR